MDLTELAQNERFASLGREAEADGLRRQQQAAEEAALARFDAELAAAGWSDAYDRVSGHVYYYHADGRTTWTNPLQSSGENQPPSGTAAAADVGRSGVTASSSPASIKRDVEARIAARHQERAATLALVAVVHQSPEIASKLVSLQKGRVGRGRRKPARRQAARRTSEPKRQQQNQPQLDGIPDEAAGRGWAVGLDGILEASSLADGTIDQRAFDQLVESAEQQQLEARTPRTPVGRPAGENCPAPPVTPPPASDTNPNTGELASLVLSAQREDGTIDIDQLDRSITLEESEEPRALGPQPCHDSKDLETLRLSVLGQSPPQTAGGLSASGSGSSSSGNGARPTSFAPYPTSPQTAQLVPLQERSGNARVEAGGVGATGTGKLPSQQRRQRGDSGSGGRGGGCCGSRPW